MNDSTPILTASMAKQVHGMIAQVHIPAGQAAQALQLLNAVAAIANGETVVVPASDAKDGD